MNTTKTKLRTAKVFIASVWAQCPVCGSEEVIGEDGSMNITTGTDQVLECIACGEKLALPKRVVRQ